MELQAESQHVLELLVACSASEDELLSDEALNTALDPFRGRGPFRVHCGREGCTRTISWWALPVRGRSPFPDLRGRPYAMGGESPVTETGFVFGNGLWPIEGARVVHSSFGPRRAEIRGETGKSVQSWHPDPYKDWSIGVVSHEHDAQPLDSLWLKFLFTCPRKRCEERYTLTNKEMLALLVTAVAAGKKEIRPALQRAGKGALTSGFALR